jgi:hypothetical protein
VNGYDKWLGQPYEDEARVEQAHEAFQESTVYELALATFKVENGRQLTANDYEHSEQYEFDFEAWLEDNR